MLASASGVAIQQELWLSEEPYAEYHCTHGSSPAGLAKDDYRSGRDFHLAASRR